MTNENVARSADTKQPNPFRRAGAPDITESELADYADQYGGETDPEEAHPERHEPQLWMYDREERGGVVHLRRPKLSTVNDATVIGDLADPAVEAFLNSPTVVGLTNRAPNVTGDKWGRWTGTVAEAVRDLLSLHPERPDKGGDAMFFAEGDLTGKTYPSNGQRLQYMFKLKNNLRRVYAVAIDVDGGCTVESVIPRLKAAGLFAVVYTTHSHTTKGGAKSDRFRIIIFLDQPFELGDDDDTQTQRLAEWQARYIGFCEKLIPGEIDASGSLPSQLMYAPARPVGAEYKHYIIAGRGLSADEMPMGDVSKYLSKRSGGARGGVDDGEPAFLSDGFDLKAWHGDHGEYFDLRTFLEMVGWDVLGDAGDGFDILCPNAAAHTSGGDEAWGIDGCDAEKGAAVYCHHSHCAGLYTCDMIRLIEGQSTLPDGFDTFSDLLCDDMFYPDSVDGEEVEVAKADYVTVEIKIFPLKTPTAVSKAFKRLNKRSEEDEYAALYAGVSKGGGKGNTVAKLTELMKTVDRFDANALKSLKKRGGELLTADRAAYAAQKKAERHEEYANAGDREDLAVRSLDPAEPLGETIQEALATLAYRYAPCDLGGTFRIVRKPDMEAFNSDFDSTVAIYRKDDFLNLHLDRMIQDGDALVNPAKVFLETQKRKSGMVFAPPPMKAGKNDFNTYKGRKLEAVQGEYGDERDFPTLHEFMLNVVCDGCVDKLKWLTLWMAHQVQRPGDKPGTSIIAIGAGGIGKGRFGAVLGKLAAPHFKILENEAHVTGQFAGEHLSQCTIVQVNEAVFGQNPRVSSTLKSLVDAPEMQVEMKGFSLTTVKSCTSFYFDSNAAVPVLIENNGSERRYFVLGFNDARKGQADYFEKLTAAIEGEEMSAFVSYLEAYDPASAGGWMAVRAAPETRERRTMGFNSMNAATRRILDVLRDGEVELTVAGEVEVFTADAGGLRVPRAAFRDFIARVADKRNATETNVAEIISNFFGVEITEGRGKVGSNTDTRWWNFPPEILGDNVDKAILGE